MSKSRLGLLALVVMFLGTDVLWGQEKKVTIKATKEHVEFYSGDELVTRYHIAPTYTKPIFWPVYAPGKIPLTRSWPMAKDVPGEATDHIHQRSAWFCHGDVIPEGIELKDRIKGVEGVDFWSENKGHGWIVCTKARSVQTEGSIGSITTENEWRTSNGVKIMDEIRDIRLYDFGKSRLIVLEIDLHASVCPITFGDTKEGAMGIRVNEQIRTDKGKGKLENAEGKVGEKECWGRISAWTDYSGPIDGKVAGIAVLADPKNAHPTCWHIRGYGLNAGNPFGRFEKAKFPDLKGKPNLVKLAKGDHLKLRYGLLLHEGDAQAAGVAEQYRRFVDLRKE